MHKISPFAIGLAIFSLVFAAGFWFLVIPKIKMLSADQASLQQLLAKTAVASVPTSSDTAAQKADTASEALTLVPTTDGQYDLTIQLEAMMKSLNLPITSLDAIPAPITATSAGPAIAKTAAPAVKVVNINLSTSGTYQQIQQLVSTLNTLDRYIIIDQINLSTSGTGGSAVSAQITAFAFYLP